MAFPGIISRLHSDLDSHSPSARPGSADPAEAFWFAMAMQGTPPPCWRPSPDSCSLYLEGQATRPLRSHDGVVAENGTLALGNGHTMTLARGERAMAASCRKKAFAEMAQWLEAGHRHFICSTAVQPGGAGHPQHLASRSLPRPSLCSSFTPLLCEATEADYLAVLLVRAGDAIPRHAWAEGLYEV